jgi:hypothetical protein
MEIMSKNIINFYKAIPLNPIKMGKGLDYKFFSYQTFRGPTCAENIQMYRNFLLNHQGNTNKDHNEIPVHTI